MQKSETIGELAKALCKVQAGLKPALKDSQNPYFKSSYADLNSVWDACRELLTSNGLAVAQMNLPTENGVIVETMLMHTSGEWISGELFLPLAKHDPQGVGSALTYGRRYGLAAMVGIVADVDDDGNHASGKTQQPQQRAQTRQYEPNPTMPLVNGIEQNPPRQQPAQRPQPSASGGNDEPMSEKQSRAIFAICKSKGLNEREFLSAQGVTVKDLMTKNQATTIIETLCHQSRYYP